MAEQNGSNGQVKAVLARTRACSCRQYKIYHRMKYRSRSSLAIRSTRLGSVFNVDSIANQATTHLWRGVRQTKRCFHRVPCASMLKLDQGGRIGQLAIALVNCRCVLYSPAYHSMLASQATKRAWTRCAAGNNAMSSQADTVQAVSQRTRTEQRYTYGIRTTPSSVYFAGSRHIQCSSSPPRRTLAFALGQWRAQHP